MLTFSGSYHPEDVVFLLKRLAPLPVVAVAEKERLIQSGERHYSEMLAPEILPSPLYMELFEQSVAMNSAKMAQDCLTLAGLIAERRGGPITLVSLARAGTPIGVIVKHLLQRAFGRPTVHYSISIIRDRGIDQVALRHVLQRGHSPQSIVFVDGWTGKGVIARELEKAIGAFNRTHNVAIDAGLHVLSDLAGMAACAASANDYLIPSSILNSTVSGLISRSVLNASIGPEDFHGCVYYEAFEEHDLSRDFADQIIAESLSLAKRNGTPMTQFPEPAGLVTRSRAFVEATMALHGLSDVNLIKPGIGEATRVLLRRVPRLLILRDAKAADVAHLLVLAEEKSVPIQIDSDLPYQAVSLIRSIADG